MISSKHPTVQKTEKNKLNPKKKEKIQKRINRKLSKKKKSPWGFLIQKNELLWSLFYSARKRREKGYFWKKRKESKALQKIKKVVHLKRIFRYLLRKINWAEIQKYRFSFLKKKTSQFFEVMFLAFQKPTTRIRHGIFPIKPTHFEFSYRLCEGIVLCRPQKFYNFALLQPVTLP